MDGSGMSRVYEYLLGIRDNENWSQLLGCSD